MNRFDKIELSIVGTGLALFVLGLSASPAPKVEAQVAEKAEAEFVRVNKKVEVIHYSDLGVRDKSWTDDMTILRHRTTGSCWIGSYFSFSASEINGQAQIVWTPAPPGVCK